ncbi:MAG: hypothetical protein H7Y13_11560 [Sphingobacteriaceae bacterium]|nr:hypothetical protein [Sphingobacteriaceae bacterium]
MNKKLLLISSFILLISLKSIAQNNLKGLWNGTITTDNHDAYAGYLVNIEEHKDGVISGKALLYKPNIFAYAFGVQQFYGIIEKGVIKINDIQILDSRMPTSQFYMCFKLSTLQYNSADGIESLTGDWTSETEGCLPGKVFLSRFDEKKPSSRVPEYVLEAIKRHGTEPGFKKTSLSPPVVLKVKNRVLRLELKDYLKEDNDTVTIYLNRLPVFSNLKIKKKAYKFIIWLDASLPVNELIMYANNLGTIPPNTSNLLISDGEATHKLFIESSLQKSVAIYLKYTPK